MACYDTEDNPGQLTVFWSLTTVTHIIYVELKEIESPRVRPLSLKPLKTLLGELGQVGFIHPKE